MAEDWRRRLASILIDYSYIVIIFFLPINGAYRLYDTIYNFFKYAKEGNAETHAVKLRRIQKQIKKWRADGGKKQMCSGRAKTASVMYTAPNYRDTLHRIGTSDLTDIIKIDTQKKTVLVEPYVTMGQLTGALIPLGWTIPVVPELEMLTVGGLVMGGGIETSSHKYGAFHRTCASYEMVISSGEAVTCSKEENPELFRGIPLTYGTLGFLTAVEIDIIEAPRFVRLDYHPIHNFEEGVSKIQKYAHDFENNDYVEGFLFSQNQWVIMTGKMVNTAEPGKINRQCRWYTPWFFRHAEQSLEKGETREYIPLREYFHRHTKCSFWFFSEDVPFGNHPLFRYLFGWTLPLHFQCLKGFLGTTIMTELQSRNVLQDFIVTGANLSEMMRECQEHTQVYPLWVCPGMGHADEPARQSANGDEMHYDVGVYGKNGIKNFNMEAATKHLEKTVIRLGGFQALYTDSYLSLDEFNQMFNLKVYDRLRNKYDAEVAFPHVFIKTSIKARQEGISTPAVNGVKS